MKNYSQSIWKKLSSYEVKYYALSVKTELNVYNQNSFVFSTFRVVLLILIILIPIF